MLSISCKYALRAAVFLMSEAHTSTRFNIQDVADAIDANEHTTAKILQSLVKAEIINSAKGPTGGFYILANAKKIFLIDIVQVIDGDQVFYGCGLGLKECSEERPCPIHYHYKAAREKLLKDFSTISIQQLSKNLALGKAFLK
jgi:Rrf2 family protein